MLEMLGGRDFEPMRTAALLVMAILISTRDGRARAVRAISAWLLPKPGQGRPV